MLLRKRRSIYETMASMSKAAPSNLGHDDAQRLQETKDQHKDQGPRPFGYLETELQIPSDRSASCSTALDLSLSVVHSYRK